MVVVYDPVTEGPDPKSKEIGRAQGMYINSQLDGKGLHLMLSVIFTDGEFKGSTLEIPGADLFAMKEREFSIVSGTGSQLRANSSHLRSVPGPALVRICDQEVAFTGASVRIYGEIFAFAKYELCK
uniref:Dirigent protein n=1 Tax=Nicotiana tabacum TaxID=4097 RepID=A0A1S4D2T5_TOBAC|nr:PREDICTED: dirigent protein 1-like [Nicotiana tabacum]